MQDNALYLHSLIMVKLLPIPDSKSYHAEKLFSSCFNQSIPPISPICGSERLERIDQTLNFERVVARV